MPINSNVNQRLNTIIRTVTGKLTLSDIKRALTETISYPDFKPNMHVIWDLADAELNSTSTLDIIDVIDLIRSSSENRGDDYKMMIIAPKDLNYGLSRMFAAFADELTISIHVLRNIDEAYQCIEKTIRD